MSKVSVFLKEAVSRNLSKLKRWELPANGDYDGKMPNFTFYRGRKQVSAYFSFCF